MKGGDSAEVTCVATDERCNGEDDDCDGEVDEDATDAETVYEDADGDGFGAEGTGRDGCVGARLAGDCDDGDAAISPAADETCGVVDANCDGLVPEECPTEPIDVRTVADARIVTSRPFESIGIDVSVAADEATGDDLVFVMSGDMDLPTDASRPVGGYLFRGPFAGEIPTASAEARFVTEFYAPDPVYDLEPLATGCSGLGDVDGDGQTDLALSLGTSGPDSEDDSEFYLVRGPLAGASESLRTEHVVWSGKLARACTVAGDLTGDGLPDPIVNGNSGRSVLCVRRTWRAERGCCDRRQGGGDEFGRTCSRRRIL